ncbi:outer membrane transport energization protein TonB [Pseudomonas sp. WPR_5_2]|uniref:energy transducer TonB n=1 Tax=Pseudomonas sp. WPR_5_2 TaxID=1907371 RepID=UPI000EB1E98F|nr:energy transducer TonB [Pseudomonas sp. WPR_5_2]RKS24691.1 outer membrane transport energization protein TonB [Pseudomonas sp. WPR_5_2]
MKHFWGYLLLSIALHLSVGWLLREFRAEAEPLAWQPPMAIQVVNLEPVAKAIPAPAVRSEPVRQPLTLPKADAPAKANPIPIKPLPVSTQPAIVKAATPAKPQPKTPPPPRAEPRPVQPASAPTSTAQNANPSAPTAAPTKTPLTLPTAMVTPAPPLTPVVSLRPSFVTPPPAPRYPNTARRRNQQGIVRVEVHLDERGRQLKRVLTRSSGVDSLDQAALEAVTQWRFRPEIVDGRAVPSRVEIPIEFALTANR